MRRAPLPYCRPALDAPAIAAVVDCLQNGWLTSGPRVREFEEAFAARSGVRHAVALSSCTAALHVALHAMGVGPGDEVVTPSFTFVAGAQSARWLGATPVFADVDPVTLCVNVETIEAAVTPRTKAIITLPYAGRPLDLEPIVAFAQARGIRVLEDAAHSAGMLDRGRWAGARSDAAAYSFYATKNLTTAEGGMLLTNDDALAERARLLSLHGMSKDAWKRYAVPGAWRYDVTEPGFKFNLPDPLAALGIEQLNRLDAMQSRRDAIAARYREGLARVPGIRLQAPVAREGDRHSWCMFVVLVDEREAGLSRDALVETLAREGIGTAVHYVPTHLFTGYRAFTRGALPRTEEIWQQVLSLPLYPSMSDADVDDVLNAIERATRGTTASLSAS
jgi:dTDP-4-amino-4,6-dideoxygalactose transaminase